VSHVLGRFSPNEIQLVSEVLQLVLGAVELSLKQGVEQAMNRYNNRSTSVTKDAKQAALRGE
jgi:PTH1 family peptidyl-tRNA hydrolase